MATFERADWFNRRLHSACGDIPPVEYNDAYYSIADLTDEQPAATSFR